MKYERLILKFFMEGKLDKARSLQDKVDWLMLSTKYLLSEDFIFNFQNKVIWYWIIKQQSLTEAFLEDNKNNVDWYALNRFHGNTLSNQFKRKFDKLLKSF